MEETTGILIAARNEESRNRITETLVNLNEFIISDVINDETDAIIKTDRFKPNVIIMDLQLAAEYGINIVRILRRRSPSSAIIIIGDKDDAFACSALNAGISGFLIKEEDLYKLEIVVKLILSGGKYVSTSIFDRVFNAVSLINQFPGQFMEVRHPLFTPAERCIITDLAKGFSDDEIADDLHLSKGSIRNIITAIRRKTKMKSRIGIVVFSLVYGLIRLDDFGMWNEMRDIIFQENENTQSRTKKRGRKPKVM
jgi:DNA-binding NarL/FixJ family response regulator